MSFLSARAFQLVLSTLSGDATFTSNVTGGIFLREAPQSVVPPYAVLALQSPLPDIQGRASQVVMGRGLMSVTIWGFPADMVGKLVPAADRADVLLNTLLGSAGGATIIRVVREHELLLKGTIGQTGIEEVGVGFVYAWWAQ
jgi:hypothetical protein